MSRFGDWLERRRRGRSADLNGREDMECISREQALEIARAECERRGWLWHEPIQIIKKWRGYEILLNPGIINSPFIAVSSEDGSVLFVNDPEF